MFTRHRSVSLAVSLAFATLTLALGSAGPLFANTPPAGPAPDLNEAVRQNLARAACANTVVTNAEPVNYVWTVAGSAIAGALAGALIGGAVYLLDDGDQNWSDLGYWAAGGVLAGAAAGVVQIIVQEGRASEAVSRRGLRQRPAGLPIAFARGRF
jgi:uncharacterized protein YcfJ